MATPLPDLLTRAEAAQAVGGSKQLVELLDRNKDGVVDDDAYAEAMEAAQADVYSLVGTSINIRDTNVPQAPVLRTQAKRCFRYHAHVVGKGGQAMPAGVRDDYNEAIGILKEFRSGDRVLDIVEEAGGAMPAHKVDMTAGGKGWTRGQWGRFC